MKKAAKRFGIIVLTAALICSVVFNVYLVKRFQAGGDIWNIHEPDANTRETYATIHHVKEAQEISTGAGIKVGILDWGFGFEDHDGLYAGGKDFTTYEYHDENFNHASEHGFWMAQTLKEIAPDVEVYALGTYVPDDEAEWVDAMIEAVHWSMEQEIVTTFIHYDNPNNILPWGIWENGGDGYYRRDADLNIFQYDYNTLFLESYGRIAESPEFDGIYKDELHLSVSSMSVVTAGFVAMLEEIDDTLSPAEYKEILLTTSRPMEYAGERAEHVVDIEAAVRYLAEKAVSY